MNIAIIALALAAGLSLGIAIGIEICIRFLSILSKKPQQTNKENQP